MSLEAKLEALSALASGLCHDAGIGLELHPQTWAWDPVRRVLMVARDDLSAHGPDLCAGIVAHEVGHFFTSRYTIFEVDFDSPAALALALNSIEDPRVETWIRRRYPGAAAWLRSAAEVYGHPDANAVLPDFIRFCGECAAEGRTGWRPNPDPAASPPAVIEALSETREARIRYANTLPPVSLDPTAMGTELGTRYREEVWPWLTAAASRWIPPRVEQAVRLSAAEALRVAVDEVLPVARRLLQADRERVAQHLAGDPERAQRARDSVRRSDARAAARIVGEATTAERAKHTPRPSVEAVANELLDVLMRSRTSSPVAEQGGAPGQPGHGRSPLLGSPDEAGQSPVGPTGSSEPLQVRWSDDSSYERARAAVASQIDRLAGHIEEVLRPRKRLRTVGGYPTGQRVDLRLLMAFHADPRRYDDLWMRSSIPERRDAAVMLLVDLSGSMRGDKATAALQGSVLLVECLSQLGIPFAVIGFQDEIIPFANFGDGLTASARRAIGEMPLEVAGERPDGHNEPAYNDDGPCLRRAAALLLDYPCTDRLLISVSDGYPEGRHSDEHDLEQAIAELRNAACDVELVGVGLGPDTEHVREFYPESIAEVPVDRFASEIGALLERALTKQRI